MENAKNYNSSNIKGYNPKFLYFGLLFIMYLEYLRLVSYFPFLNFLKAYVTIPTTIFLCALIFSKGNISNRDIFLSSNFRILCSLLLIMLLSISNSANVDLSMDYVSGTIGYFFLFFIIIKILDNPIKFYGFFLSITAIHLIIIFMNIDVLTNPHSRSYLSNLTFLGDGNDFALSVCITIPACLYLVATTKSKMLKYTCIAGFLILVLTVIGTQSRGASLSLMAIMLYYGLKSKRKVRLVYKLAPVLLIVMIYAPSEYFGRLEHINNYQEASAQGRISAWKAGIKMAKDHPFIGVGPGLFPATYAAKYPDETNQGYPTAAHSTFFLALGELGFTGLIIIIAFFSSNLIKNERLAGQLKKISAEQDHANHILLLKTINASIIALMVAGAFLSALYYPHIYLLAGVSGACRLFITKHVFLHNKI